MIVCCPFMLDIKSTAILKEFQQFVQGAIILQNPFHFDTMTLIRHPCEQDELSLKLGRLTRLDCCTCRPWAAIHADMEIFPARLAAFYLLRHSLLMANPINLAKALYINMEYISGTGPLIAANFRLGLQRGKLGNTQLAYPGTRCSGKRHESRFCYLSCALSVGLGFDSASHLLSNICIALAVNWHRQAPPLLS